MTTSNPSIDNTTERRLQLHVNRLIDDLNAELNRPGSEGNVATVRTGLKFLPHCGISLEKLNATLRFASIRKLEDYRDGHTVPAPHYTQEIVITMRYALSELAGLKTTAAA